MKINLNLKVSTDGGVVTPPPPPVWYSGYRGLHFNEGGYENPLGMPIVLPPITSKALRMTEVIQWISFKLMTKLNNSITPTQWTRVHDDDRVHTNFKGFIKGNDDAIMNFITGDGLNSGIYPHYDKAFRSGGGQFLRGYEVGDRLRCVPGIHGLDALALRSSFSSREQMFEYVDQVVDLMVSKQWYVYGLNRYKTTVGHFTQGNEGPVVFPFIFQQTIEFELKWFDRWESNELPDPTKFYK